MTFFERCFGFAETTDASMNKAHFMEMASFSVVTESDLWLHRPIRNADEAQQRRNAFSFTPIGNGVDLAGGAEGGGALKRTLSSAGDDVVQSIDGGVVGERCVFTVKHEINSEGDRKELPRDVSVYLDAGIFSTPSVGELRERVKQLSVSLTPFEKDLLRRVSANTFRMSGNGGEGDGSSAPVIHLQNITGDSFSLHGEPETIGGVVQAASQFNMLEFCSPNVIPEKGITGYLYDRTQGPACAIACAAGTAYRNYLAPMDTTKKGLMSSKLGASGEGAGMMRGQSRDLQLNGLLEFTSFLMRQRSSSSSSKDPFYRVVNGYVDATETQLTELSELLGSIKGHHRLPELLSTLRVGVQEDTQVTAEGAGCQNTKVETTDPSTGKPKVVWRKRPIADLFPPRVTQVYCSALSVGYSRTSAPYWEPFARLVLHGTYEATYYVAMINTIKLLRQGKLSDPNAKLPRTLLTKVGGGVFGNDQQWIKSAMLHATVASLPFQIPLSLSIVHYGQRVEAEYLNFPKNLMTHPRVAKANCWAPLSDVADSLESPYSAAAPSLDERPDERQL